MMEQLNIFDYVPTKINPGDWVKESDCGEELTFDEMANMVGQTIIISKFTSSLKAYKAVRIERIVLPAGNSSERILVYYDGVKQRGMISERWFDKNSCFPEFAWRLKTMNRQYPIILGMTPPNKQGIGIKSKLGSGYDLYILDEDMTHQYAQLHFCNIEAVDRMIDLLQRMKELWEREEET